MIRLVCRADCDVHPGMQYELEVGALIFLDKKNSPLITRMEKGSAKYKTLAMTFKESEKWDKSKSYRIFNGDILYNEEKDYFVDQSSVSKDGIKWRIHPHLIEYVDKTDQKEFKIVIIPKGKKLTISHIGNEGWEIIVVSDGDCQVL